MTMKSKLLTGAGLLVLSTGFALAAPAVVQSAVNLRAGPGVDFPVITAMPAGAQIDVMGCRDAWCRVAFGRTVGFTSRDFLALGGPIGPGGPGYATYSEGYGPGYVAVDEGYEYGGGYAPGGTYSYGGTTGYSRGYGGTAVGTEFRGGTREERLGARTVSNESRTSETRTSGELKGNNPMRIRASTQNPNLRPQQGQAAAIKGNNPMRVRASTANPNLRTAGPPAAIRGNNPMKMPQRSTATGGNPPSQTTGAAPRERRQP